MMKKLLFTLSIASLFGVEASAQKVMPCGTDDVYRRQLEAHPEIAARNAALSEEIANKLAAADFSKYAKTTADDGTTVYHVPLVFHIIHNYGNEYLTDDTIKSCVARINSMYNKKNSDTSVVIAPFKGFINNSKTRYIGNARIEWHLATIDPDGKPTNGITRRRTYLATSGSDMAKYDQWPSNNYMNIWLIAKMSASHDKAAAYAYKPATGDVIPYYDGVIGLASAISEYDYTYSHELGHELNLDHVWGGTNDPDVACGDDEVDDTPLTRGHNPGSCGFDTVLYDTSCLYKRNQTVAKLRLDSFMRLDKIDIVGTDTTRYYSPAIKTDNSTTKGISFQNRTASSLEAFTFYPAAAIGSSYKIGLTKNGVLLDSVSVVSTVVNNAQKVVHHFVIPPADTLTTFKLRFIENPGAWKDTATPGSYSFPKGFNGTVWIKNPIADVSTDNYYNFFYDLRITYGYYKIYANDSLVDYPDTTNSQNVMDYTYCSHMFTAGQAARMRAALTSTVANRNQLFTEDNLRKTGALVSNPALAPKAELSVERAVNASGSSTTSLDPSYFLCSEAASSGWLFKFRDRTWQAPATTTNWTLSNGATAVTAGTGTAYKFATPGWASVKIEATNANGTSTFEAMPGVYVADPVAVEPVGYIQEFVDDAMNAKWPMFNYYNNRYKWEIANTGVFDGKSIRYRTYDDRVFPDIINGEAAGDYDDFFTPAFDLSKLGTNGNLNFMYSGAYATNNVDLMKDVLEVAYSTTCGATWTTLKTMSNTQLQTAGSIPTSEREFVPKWNEWKPISIDLKTTTTIRDPRVFFRFRYKPSSRPFGQYALAAGNNFYIDRIMISNNPLSVNEMVLGTKQAAVAPNPTNSNAFVLLQKSNAKVTVQVLDITGKLVYSVTEKIDQNNAKIEIPAANIAAKGLYMVRIIGEDNLNQTEKLIVY